jgi:putative membrane protein (TIGR04086 family)
MLKLDLSSAVISGGINFIYIVSAFIGGFFVGKKVGQRKFLWGFVSGVMYFVVIMLVSLLVNRTSALPLGSMATVFIICSLSGMLGGMIS